ncbi:hypothetical protein KA012_02645 [Candidatus Woesebacteria bacterium]|nr:hypothetical protein [Candidatus Woesebacteria bacterium]
MQGEPATELELIADNTPELKISFQSDGNAVDAFINYHTYYLATAHHLLEKGNRYELTGKQLSHLVKIFDFDDFQRIPAAWIATKAKEVRGVLPVMPNHQEIVSFRDGMTIRLASGHYAALTTNRRLKLLDFKISSDRLSSLRVISDQSNISLVNLDGEWMIVYLDESYKKISIPISEHSDLQRLVSIAERIRQKILAGPDKHLEGSIEELRKLADFTFNLPKTN